MFSLSNQDRFDASWADISSGLEVILEDDGEPVIFTGFNALESRILGSSLFDDVESQTARFIHSVVVPSDYAAFINRNISYLDILRKQPKVFIVDRTPFASPECYLVELQAIPQELLPTEHSFLPDLDISSNVPEYTIKLEGGYASNHRLEYGAREQTEEHFHSLVSDVMGLYTAQPKVLSLADVAGSYSISLLLDFGSVDFSDLFIEPKHYVEFINNYFTYLLRDFINEATGLASLKDFTTPNFERLAADFLRLRQVTGKSNIAKQRERFVKNLFTSVSHLRDISELRGMNFNTMSLSNKSDGRSIPLGFLDQELSQTIEDSVERMEDELFDVQDDPEDRTYKIQIYHLNTQTRKGNAYVLNPGNEAMAKPRIRINGDTPLERTKYAESLFENKWIEIKGRGRHVNGTMKHLTVQYENSSAQLIDPDDIEMPQK